MALLAGLQEIIAALSHQLAALDAAREQALRLSRELIRCAAVAIKHLHRGELCQARAQLAQATDLLSQLKQAAAPYPALLASGFVVDAEKEYAEAALLIAALAGEPAPAPEQLGVDPVAWLNGLAEVVGELRRHVLDLIRLGRAPQAEPFLALMEDIYYHTLSFDYPSAVVGGLRSRTDAARGSLERTRGELTMALQQAELQASLQRLHASSPPR
jgi:translin